MRRPALLTGFTFEVRRGEIVGLWGYWARVGPSFLRAWSDSTPLMLGRCFGPAVPDPWKCTRSMPPMSGFVTEDRRAGGIHAPLSVAENLSLPSLRTLPTNGGLWLAQGGSAQPMLMMTGFKSRWLGDSRQSER